ncbi:MAG: SulP family inorganic anion transporter [Ruminococcaceae bacterium]|nr:SulP family inorganic anion transporter [Oscillospiraceae bacterium]
MFIKSYVTKLKNEFSGYNLQKFSKDLMAGITVTAVALPLALAFGVACGATAEAGLVTAIIAGLIMSALAGASYQISGPTGAMSAILVGIVASSGGIQSIFVVSVLAGVIILLCAVFKLGRLVSMIPRPVITGFTSGIALTIALGQIDNFFGTTSVGTNPIEKIGSYFTNGFNLNWRALLIGAIVIAIMLVWPKKWNSKVPSSLVSIIVATIISVIFGFGEHIDLVGQIPQKLILDERFSFSAIDWKSFGSYISPAFSIAALALIESLLCGASASKMKNEEFDANQEIIAQGVGNIIVPFFGGVPATAAIARTSVAIKSGAQTRLCGIIHAVGLLISMFLLAPVMAKIPLSALAGVLMVTAWRMNEWGEIKTIFSKKFIGGIAKFLVTMIATIVFDLTIAIVIGIVLSAFMFIYRSSKSSIEIKDFDEEKYGSKSEDITKIMYVKGPLFFANIGKLERVFKEELQGVEELIISLDGVNAIDTSGTSALVEHVEALRENNVKVIMCGASPSVLSMLEKLNIKEIVGEDKIVGSLDGAIDKTIDHVSVIDKK